jgi:NitT/TauT family transport system permease protein
MEFRPMTAALRAGATSWLWRNRHSVIGGLAAICTWELAARASGARLNLFPPPCWVLWILYALGDLIAQHAWLTFYQTILGFLISVILGVMIGWMIGKSRWLEAALYPSVVVLQALPKEALAPLLILWFGAGLLSKMTLVSLISFFPVVINTVIGIKGLDENTRRYAASLSCRGWKLFWSVEMPSAMPSIVTGLKIAVTLAVVGAVVAEIVAGRDGLGYLLLFASSRLDMSFSLGILLVLAGWGAVLFGAVELGERLGIYWR